MWTMGLARRAAPPALRRRAAARGFRTYQNLLLEQHSSGQVLSVELNRPEVYNAFSTEMAQEIMDAFDEVARSSMRGEKDIRAVVLSGAGKGFCAGADLKERNALTDAEWMEQHALFRRCARALLDSPVPVIAAVEGAAFGGGLELVLMADWIIAGEGARLAYPEVTRGLFPGLGGMQLLQRATSPNFAKEAVLTGRVIEAAEALSVGLVQGVVPKGEALDAALASAGQVAANAPLSVRGAKKVINSGVHLSREDAWALSTELYEAAVYAGERREGVAAFNEKRQPVFAPFSLSQRSAANYPAGARGIHTSAGRREYSSAAANDEQEEIHDAIRESVQALCK